MSRFSSNPPYHELCLLANPPSYPAPRGPAAAPRALPRSLFAPRYVLNGTPRPVWRAVLAGCPKQYVQDLRAIFPGKEVGNILVVPTCQKGQLDLLNTGPDVDQEKDRLLEEVRQEGQTKGRPPQPEQTKPSTEETAPFSSLSAGYAFLQNSTAASSLVLLTSPAVSLLSATCKG